MQNIPDHAAQHVEVLVAEVLAIVPAFAAAITPARRHILTFAAPGTVIAHGFRSGDDAIPSLEQAEPKVVVLVGGRVRPCAEAFVEISDDVEGGSIRSRGSP